MYTITTETQQRQHLYQLTVLFFDPPSTHSPPPPPTHKCILSPQKRSNASIPGAAESSADADVSKPKEVVLVCTADGWPLPEFQWYRGKEIIPGATESTLALALRPVPKMILDVAKNNADTNLDSEVFFREQKRFYRCARCKQISKEVPYVAYHVVCGNCKKPWIHPEIEPYDEGK